MIFNIKKLTTIIMIFMMFACPAFASLNTLATKTDTASNRNVMSDSQMNLLIGGSTPQPPITLEGKVYHETENGGLNSLYNVGEWSNMRVDVRNLSTGRAYSTGFNHLGQFRMSLPYRNNLRLVASAFFVPRNQGQHGVRLFTLYNPNLGYTFRVDMYR